MRLLQFGSYVAVTMSLLTLASPVGAAPELRVQVSQHGDFVLFGNTLAHECAFGTPAPVVGTVGDCGLLGIPDNSPDVYWRADAPVDGMASANIGIANADARSTAVLILPPGATITHAYLYWAATRAAPGTDPTVTLDRVGGFTQDIDAGMDCDESLVNSFQCVADVSSVVQAQGEGAYRISGVEAAPLANVNNGTVFAGWYMIVLYALPAEPLRNLAIFDGFDVVSGAPQEAVLDGFLVPNMGISGKLGLAVFEGDSVTMGDQFFFNGGPALGDAVNPANNFFNSSRSYLGVPVSNPGDLPQLLGTPGSMSGLDLDVLDVTAKLTAGQTMATISGTTSGDAYFLAAFVTSISDFRPDFTTATKSAEDLDGGGLLPGDTIEYTILAINTGNDAAIDVVLSDPLPPGVTYVPDSLQISAGPNGGAKSDALADDQGEYDANTNTVVFRLGAGADGTSGGKLAIGESSEAKFRVTVDLDAQGSIKNQGVIKAGGEMGAPSSDTLTDGNGDDDGAPPTESVIDQCGEDADCTAPDTPVCLVAVDPDPNTCVQCVSDGDCGPLTPTCDPNDNTCSCIASGDEVCDGADNDCNGEADEGFEVGDPCSVGLGECAADGLLVCDGPDATACDAVPGEPSIELCDELDNDCDDAIDNACVACDVDADCGADDSGKVCDDAKLCIDGCRGTGGNGCPDGMMCTSDDDTIGSCVPAEDTATDTDTDTSTLTDTTLDTGTDPNDSDVSDSDSSPTDGSVTNPVPTDDGGSESGSSSVGDSESASVPSGIDDEGFGCECSANDRDSGGGLLLLGLAGLTLGARRRRRQG